MAKSSALVVDQSNLGQALSLESLVALPVGRS